MDYKADIDRTQDGVNYYSVTPVYPEKRRKRKTSEERKKSAEKAGLILMFILKELFVACFWIVVFVGSVLLTLAAAV